MRADEGVPEVLLGIIEGDLESARVSIDTGGGGGTLMTWFRLWEVGMVDMRLALLVSVGLIVLAPSPVAWEEWCPPGIMEARLLPVDDGVEPLPPPRGERGANVDKRFGSGVRASAADKFAWLSRGGGCTDLAFALLELPQLRVASRPVPEDISIDVLVVSPPVLSPNRLGRRRWLLAKWSLASPMTPGPMDLRGGFPMA